MMNAAGTYQNACGQAQTIAMGRPLAAAVQQKLGRVFQRVLPASSSGEDGAIEAALVSQRIQLTIPGKGAATYPAAVTIGLDLAYIAADGKSLFSKTIERTGRGTVAVHDSSCDVSGLDRVVQEAADLVIEAAIKPLAESRQVREAAEARPPRGAAGANQPDIPQVLSRSRLGESSIPERQEGRSFPLQATALQGSPAPAVETKEGPPASLTFRAIMRDESRDQLLQPDEPLTIEVEIKNNGPSEVRDVEVLVGGPGPLMTQLPPSIAVGTIQPGEIKRTAITETVTGVTEPLQGDVLLSLRAGSPLAQVPPVKKFTILVQPGSRADGQPLIDLDHPPEPAAALKQPTALVLAIGVGHFRDERVPSLKYAGRDADVMAAYLQTITGVASDRVRILRDGQALKQDLAEAFEEWLPAKVEANTVVYVFVAGRALVDGETGAVSLVPFDGTTSSMGRLYAVRRIQESLSRLAGQRAILMLDLSLEPSPGADPKASVVPVWETGRQDQSDRIMWMIGSNSLQEARDNERARHGLFTYQLLKGLQGLADLDRDGTVVAGELCTYARGEIGRAAHKQFGHEQEPLCTPPSGQGAMVRIQPMAKGNNPKLAPTVKKESPGSSGSPNAPDVGIGPGS